MNTTDDYQKLFAKALHFLSYRPRTKKEVIDNLKKKTEDETLINRIVAELEELKLVNDAEFARWLVESRSRSRPGGKRLLVRELQQKGIDKETLSEVELPEDEKELASRALTKKVALWQHLSYREFQVKAGRFLSSRGFSWSVIEDVVKKAYNTKDVK